jgi:nitrate/nitrite-specific signal transduction histidine kinase
MSQAPTRPEFVRRIFEEGVAYMEQLLEENERLRLQLAKERDHDRAASPEEITRLRSQLALALEDGASSRRQLEALRDELDRVTSENREFADNCVSLQEKQAALSSLYAASYELHASLDLQEVLASLQEIIVNLLGSESFAIYLADEKQQALRIAVEIGLPPLAPRVLEFGHGVIGRAVGAGEPWTEVAKPVDDEPHVIVPLKVRTRVVGALAIFRFLKQKKGISELDRELFRLLSAQAATALHGATLFAKEARRAATFEGLVDLIRTAVPKSP